MYGMDYAADGPTESPVMAEAPLGQDFHQSINEIREIDDHILKLRKRRESIAAKIAQGMDEVQRHYNDVQTQTRPEF